MQQMGTRRRFLRAAGGVGVGSLAGCFGTDGPSGGSQYDRSVDHDLESWDRYDPEWSPPTTSPLEGSYRVETIIENLEIPWDLAFAPTGALFLTERVGRISRYAAGDLEEVAAPGDVIDHARAIEIDEEGGWWKGGSEGGLLGLAVHPRFPEVPLVYAYYTYQAGDDDYRNRLVHYDVENGHEETVVLDDVPGNRLAHNGGRIAFGPRNYLWVTTGDAAERDRYPQDPGTLAGKVLRLEPDGSGAADNPDRGDPRVYTYGHRNPQGITWLPDGTPVAAEHGPQGSGDEVLVLEADGNYGWPSVRAGPGNDSYESYGDRPDVVNPLVNTGGDAWAPPGGVFYTGDAVPSLRNRFVLGGLISQRLNVVTIYKAGDAPDIGGERFTADWMDPAYDAVAHRLFEDELGRVRHVEQGPDGDLYAITSNRDGRASEQFPKAGDDRLVKIVPDDG